MNIKAIGRRPRARQGAARAALCTLALAVATGLGITNAAWAQAQGQMQGQPNYPTRPVRLVVAFPPGGATDVIGRDLAKGLSEIWGQPVIVDNKPGAGGLLAAESVARAAPDGYTLFLASDGAIVGVPFMVDKLPYDPLTDLKPVGLVGAIPLVLIANPTLKVNTLADFVAAAKAKPGAIDYASGGIGASHHLSMEMLQRAAGIKLNHVVYKGGAPAMQDVMAGHVPIMWSATSTALTQIKNGKLMALAMGSSERSPQLPNVPTLAELGYNFEAGNWVGVMGPAGLPAGLTEKLQNDIAKVVATPAYKNSLISQGNEARTSTAADFSSRIQREYARNKTIFAELGVNAK